VSDLDKHMLHPSLHPSSPPSLPPYLDLGQAFVVEDGEATLLHHVGGPVEGRGHDAVEVTVHLESEVGREEAREGGREGDEEGLCIKARRTSIVR